MKRHPPRVGPDRTGAVGHHRGLELLRGVLGDAAALGAEHDEADDCDVDPARVPGPELARHVRAGHEQAEDRDGEEARDLAGHDPPRRGLLDRGRRAQLEKAGEEHGARSDADEECE